MKRSKKQMNLFFASLAIFCFSLSKDASANNGHQAAGALIKIYFTSKLPQAHIASVFDQPKLKLESSSKYHSDKLKPMVNLVKLFYKTEDLKDTQIEVSKLMTIIQKVQIATANSLSVRYLALWLKSIGLSDKELSQTIIDDSEFDEGASSVKVRLYSQERTLIETVGRGDSVGAIDFSFFKNGVKFEGQLEILNSSIFPIAQNTAEEQLLQKNSPLNQLELKELARLTYRQLQEKLRGFLGSQSNKNRYNKLYIPKTYFETNHSLENLLQLKDSNECLVPASNYCLKLYSKQ